MTDEWKWGVGGGRRWVELGVEVGGGWRWGGWKWRDGDGGVGVEIKGLMS